MLSLDYYLHITVYIVLIILYLLLWKYRSKGTIVLSPFVFFAGFDAMFNWPSTLSPPAGVPYSSYYGFITILASLSFFIVMFFVTLLSSRVRFKFTRFRLAPVFFASSSKRIAVIVLALALLASACSLFLFGGLPPLTQVVSTLITGEGADDASVDVALGRREVTKGHVFGGAYRGQGVIRHVMATVAIAALSLAILAHQKFRTLFWKFLIIFTLFIAFFSIAGVGDRGPFLFSIVMIIALLSFVRPLNIKVFVSGIVVLFAIFMILSIVTNKASKIQQSGSGFVLRLLGLVAERVLLGNGQNTVHTFAFLNERKLSHTHGAEHLRNFLAAIPGAPSRKPFAYTLTVMLGGGTTTYRTPTYLSILYLDFGLPGVVIGYALLGAFIGILENIILTWRKTPENLFLMGLIAVDSAQMVQAGFIGFIAKYFVVMLIYISIYISLHSSSSCEILFEKQRLY